MKISTPSIRRALERFATEHLALILGAVFVIDLLVPDMLPFIDEIVLGAATLLVARWQARRHREEREAEASTKPPPKDVTPD
ncbi:MAG: DUF6116 family protein [Acidobacteriota bacterium]